MGELKKKVQVKADSQMVKCDSNAGYKSEHSMILTF